MNNRRLQWFPQWLRINSQMARYSGYMYDTMTYRYIFRYVPQLENEQQKIVMVLTMRKKEFEVIDIMKPGNQVFVSQKSTLCDILNLLSESPNLHARSWQEKGRPEKCFTSPDFQRWRLHRGERKVTPKVLLKHRKHIRVRFFAIFFWNCFTGFWGLWSG